MAPRGMLIQAQHLYLLHSETHANAPANIQLQPLFEQATTVLSNMAASPFLLRIISKPTGSDVESWSKWYTSEGLPALFQKIKATRGVFYHAYNNFILATKTPLDVNKTQLHNVHLKHTDLEPPTDKTSLTMCQLESIDDLEEIFRVCDLTGDKTHGSVSDIRVYKLIQDFDPQGVGHCECIELLFLDFLLSMVLTLGIIKRVHHLS